MQKKQLDSLLHTLHSELEQGAELDTSSKDLLKKLVVDIQKHIDPNDTSDQSGLSNSLEKAVYSFKESHPTISKTLNSIVDSLNTMGI